MKCFRQVNALAVYFAEKVQGVVQRSGNRTILAAGCDVPPATPEENMIAFRDACQALANN